MAEWSHWWTEKWLRSPLFLSLSLTIYLPTNLSMYVFIYRSIYIYISLSLSLSSNYLSIYLSLSISIYLYLSLSISIYCQCRNYRTEVEEYEGTVIYRTLLFYNSVFLGRREKKVFEITPNFFRRSIILVGALLFYNYGFPHFSHISHFRSIINVSRAPFYN